MAKSFFFLFHNMFHNVGVSRLKSLWMSLKIQIQSTTMTANKADIIQTGLSVNNGTLAT